MWLHAVTVLTQKTKIIEGKSGIFQVRLDEDSQDKTKIQYLIIYKNSRPQNFIVEFFVQGRCIAAPQVSRRNTKGEFYIFFNSPEIRRLSREQLSRLELWVWFEQAIIAKLSDDN